MSQLVIFAVAVYAAHRKQDPVGKIISPCRKLIDYI